MVDVASEPAARSEGKASGRALLLGLAVDVAFVGAYVASLAVLAFSTPTCSTVTIERWSLHAIVPIVVPLLAVIAALVVCTRRARPHRSYGFWIGILAALLPAWFLATALAPWITGSWPQDVATWCF